MPNLKVIRKTPGLDRADAYLFLEFQKAGRTVGAEGVNRVRRIQRKATGEERNRTKYRIQQQKTQVKVELYNTVIQAAVDETGAKPHFPPYKAGSSLYFWASRKGLAGKSPRSVRQQSGGRGVAGRVRANRAVAALSKRIESVAFLIARAISRRGLPRPGDKLRKPFETVSRTFPGYATGIFDRATNRAIQRINRAS